METQDYGVQGGDVSGDVSQTMPMLGIYYYFMGFYAIYISSESESETSSITSTSTSVKSSTSQYSDEPLPTYSHLLDYSPASIDQPQPTDTIFVPRECMWDMKLVDITRDPETEGYIRSFQDHLPPNIENEDVIIINTPPTIIEDSDSGVVCLD